MNRRYIPQSQRQSSLKLANQIALIPHCRIHEFVEPNIWALHFALSQKSGCEDFHQQRFFAKAFHRFEHTQKRHARIDQENDLLAAFRTSRYQPNHSGEQSHRRILDRVSRDDLAVIAGEVSLFKVTIQLHIDQTFDDFVKFIAPSHFRETYLRLTVAL